MQRPSPPTGGSHAWCSSAWLAASVVAAVATLSLAVFAPSASYAAAPAHPFPTHVTYKVGVMPSASQATRDAAVEKAYDSWKATYLIHGCASNEYYVSTKGDGDATNNGPVSEGQGYGMNIVPLMAGYDANAQTEFNGLWQLVKDHEDQYGLMQWQLDGKTCKYYSGGTPDGATDGDLDIGYGLILADEQWGGYTADAKTWLANVLRRTTSPPTATSSAKTTDDHRHPAVGRDARPPARLRGLRPVARLGQGHRPDRGDRQRVHLRLLAERRPAVGLRRQRRHHQPEAGPGQLPGGPAGQHRRLQLHPRALAHGHRRAGERHHGRRPSLYGLAQKESTCLQEPLRRRPGEGLAAHEPELHRFDSSPDVGDTQAEEAGDSVGPSAMAAGDQAWTDAIWNQLATNPFGDGYYGETIKMLVYIVMAGDYWNPAAATAPANDFSISASPATGSVSAGGTATSTISTAVTSGSAESVALTAKGGPAGSTVSFSPASVSSGGSSTLTVRHRLDRAARIRSLSRAPRPRALTPPRTR